MNVGLRKELSILSGLGSLFFLLRKKQKLSGSLALLSAGLQFLPTKQFSFQNRSVVITGGSRGLGLALAEQLIAEAAYDTLIARDAAELNRAQVHLNAYNRVLTCVCDMTVEHALSSTFQRVIKRFGHIDVLINNAGVVSAGPFESMNIEDFEAQMNLHFFAVLKAAQTVIPLFREQGEGRIVNISSIGGKVAIPHMSSYCASKFALTGLSQALAAELRKDNIHVTTIYPGLMRTGSPIQGVFKGDHQKEFAWFAMMDSMPGFSIPARTAAKDILKSVRQGRTEAVISYPAKITTFARAHFPEVFNLLMNFVNRALPNNISQERKTGAQSKEWFEKQSWAQPFRTTLEDAQSQYNEHPKFDADYNLNIKPNPKTIIQH